MNQGIDKQVQLFDDHEEGSAIAQRYLAIINSTEYLTRSERFHKRGGSHKTKAIGAIAPSESKLPKAVGNSVSHSKTKAKGAIAESEKAYYAKEGWTDD